MHEDIEYTFEEYKTVPKQFQKFSNEEMATMQGILPDRWLELLQIYGRSTFRDGLVHLCHPDDLCDILNIILEGDSDLKSTECVPYAYSAFGYLYFYHKAYGIGEISLMRGTLICDGLTDEVPKFPENFIDSPHGYNRRI